MSKLSLQPNHGYKNFPLGTIPEDWEVTILEKVGKISAGVGFSEILQGNITGTYPFYKVSDTNIFGNEKFLIKANNYVSEEIVQEFKLKIYKRGTIIFPKVGAVLLSNKRRILMYDSIVDNNLGTFEVIKGNSDFMYYILLNIDFSKYSGEGALPSINGTTIGKIEFLLPPLPEQQKIATILKTTDDTIDLIQNIIQKIELRNKGLQQKLLTGKIRIKGFKDKEFEVLNANRIFKSISIKNYPNELLLSATQDKGIIPRNMLEGRVTMPTSEATTYKLVNPGNFIISLRSFQGGLEYSNYRGIVSPAYTVLEALIPINDEYYKYYFKSYDFIGHLAIAVIGIRDGKQISFDDFCTLNLPCPDVEEQKAIANILNKATEELNLYKQKLEKLKFVKKGLMQQLLTGKIRVKLDK